MRWASVFGVVNVAHLRREISAKARGARGTGKAGHTRLSIQPIIARRTSGTLVSLGANFSRCLLIVIWDRDSIGVGADWAALSVWDDGIGTVGRVLTDHLVAHDVSAVADADLARLWFPYILVVVQLSI